MQSQISARSAAIDLPAQVYRRLRDSIVAGKLAPGAPLIETELARRLGVSRTPLRAALQRLQQERFVISDGARRRAIVAPLTAHDLRELFFIMGALDGVAARLAAELPTGSRLRLAKQMKRLNQELRSAIEGRPRELTLANELHLRLHRTYVEAAAGPRLRAELHALQPQYERYERIYTSVLVERFGESLLEHDAIVDSLRAGDAEATERNVVLNYRNGAERYQQVVAMLGERGSW